MKKRKKKQKHKENRRNKKALMGGFRAPNEGDIMQVSHPTDVSDIDSYEVDHEAGLLERMRTQWQFGDWESLAETQPGAIVDHPERAKLALLAAAGRIQCDDINGSRELIRLATDWGCDKRHIAQVLVAGAYSTLSRIAMLTGSNDQAISHNRTAIGLVSPVSDLDLLSEARAVREGASMGLLPQAATIVRGQLQSTRTISGRKSAHIQILATEMELLNHELSLAQQRHQLYSPNMAKSELCTDQMPDDQLELLSRKSVSQLGQDVWVAKKTGFKRDGFFIEFGATDGILLSNTWLLEKELGWRGICAEPNPKFFEKLQENRDCIVSNAFIGAESGAEVGFVLAGAFGGSLEFADHDMHWSKRQAYQAVGEVITLRAISLDEFLEQHDAPRTIDYLSIDTEGNEYDVLRTFPFEKWDVRLLTIEHNYTDQREKIRRLMTAAGYTVTEQKWDDWYEKLET